MSENIKNEEENSESLQGKDLYFTDLSWREFIDKCVLDLTKVFLSFLLWSSIFCLIASLLTMIDLKDSDAFAEVLYYSNFPWWLYIAYSVIILFIFIFKYSYVAAEAIWSSQMKQLYFAIPILASLLFLTIDRVLP